MKLARVVGNIVSTIKNQTHHGYKLMLIRYVDAHDPQGPCMVAFDCVQAGIGDIVLVSTDGAAAKMLQNDEKIIADLTICGVVDSYTING